MCSDLDNHSLTSITSQPLLLKSMMYEYTHAQTVFRLSFALIDVILDGLYVMRYGLLRAEL